MSKSLSRIFSAPPFLRRAATPRGCAALCSSACGLVLPCTLAGSVQCSPNGTDGRCGVVDSGGLGMILPICVLE